MTLTASAMSRAMMCAASCALPQVREEREDATRGTALHEYLANVSTMGLAALALVPEEYRADCEALDLERLPVGAGQWAAEVALAFHVPSGTARELGLGLARDYTAARDGEVCGTADVVGLTEDAAAVVDFKSGWSDLGEAASLPQLRFLALAAARAYGKSKALVAIAPLDRGASWGFMELDAVELDVIEAEVVRVRLAVSIAAAEISQGRTPRLSVGSWCRLCPAWASCPAQGALVRRMASEPTELERDIMTALTPESAAKAYGRIKAARAMLGRVESALYAWAALNPIPLGDGQVLGMVETSKEELDGAVTRRVLAERYGQAVADAAVEWHATKSAMKEALRAVAPKGKLGATEKEALGAIREAGGVAVKTSTGVKEHRPREALPAGEAAA